MKKHSGWERSLRDVNEFRRELEALKDSELDCRKLERRIQDLTNDLGRTLMKEVFERADTASEEVEISGERWSHRRESNEEYTTLFGKVDVSRAIYSRGGRGRVAVPMELRLGMVERFYTPQVARIMTHAIGLMTIQEAYGFLGEVGVSKVSASTLHRVPQAVAARYERNESTIIEQVRKQDPIPEDAVKVQVGIDGVMVPQDGEHAKQRGRPASDQEVMPPRYTHRYGLTNVLGPAAQDGIKGRAWHEASVGTLAFYDQDGEPLRTIYLARMPESKKATLASELEEELRAVMVERPDLEVGFASDGAEQHWTLLKAIEERVPIPNPVRYLTDFFHVSGYLQKAANSNAGTGTPEAKLLASRWRETLKLHEDGAQRVLKQMRYHRDKQDNDTVREEMDISINYLSRQRKNGRTNYAEALAHHHPIGTGVTEAAAKTLVNVRMKRAGARYSQHGGQTILLFRSAILSERFQRLSTAIEATYTAQVEAA